VFTLPVEMKLSLVLLVTFIAVAACGRFLNPNPQTAVPNQYLVVLHENATVEIRDVHVADLAAKIFRQEHERILSVWNIGTFIGFAAIMSKESLAYELAHSLVSFVEADQVVTIDADLPATRPAAGGLWGLDRIDSPNLPLTGTYSFWQSSGAGVWAYVLDTGIRLTHTQFEGRAIWGTDTTGEGASDGNGHGTHVAGTIGGKDYGVANKVTLVAVKVLTSAGSGTFQGVIDGVNWVAQNHSARFSANVKVRSVANMSLGGSKTTALDLAVRAAVDRGVHFAVAAGNNAADACNYSPAGVLESISVGASTNTDARATFSNIGVCVDVFAPGQNVLSSWITSDTATNTISGTSMASPHVAGAVAVYLGHLLANDNTAVPSGPDVERYILSTGTNNVLSGIPSGTANRLLFSSYTDVQP
jgi:subtilisin family serine protease